MGKGLVIDRKVGKENCRSGKSCWSGPSQILTDRGFTAWHGLGTVTRGNSGKEMKEGES